MKYPKQIISYKRPEKVVGVDAELYSQTDDSPLEMHNGFSRFVVSIVDKKQNIAPTANIPARDVSTIFAKSKSVLDYMTKKALTPPSVAVNTEETPASTLATTEKIFLKPFVGMTPAEILLADENNKSELERLRDQVLAKNAEKYPKNKTQMEAINEAIKLLEEGKLKPETATPIVSATERPYTIYASDHKYKNKQNEKGYNLVYNITINCDLSRNNPFTIDIQNCYAPVETLPDGRRNIIMGKAEDYQKSFFSLTTEEYFEMISVIKDTKTRFEEHFFATQFKLMQENSYQHREEDK